jgi:hypothetical protein
MLQIVVNHDPETEMIVGQDPDFDDDAEYPYFEILRGPYAGTRQHFTSTDTVPDRAYVVFKARGRDDSRDQKLDPDDFGIDIQGNFSARQRWNNGNYFSFTPEFSDLNRTPEWVAQEANGWTADTLGFLVGPFEYEVRMRASDEHGRRDGTAATYSFVANYPPCVQCVELLDDQNEPVDVEWDDPCYIADCFADTSRFFAAVAQTTPDRNYMTSAGSGSIWFRRGSGDVSITEPQAPESYETVPAFYYTIRIALHGKEINDFERTGDPTERVMAWTYQMDYENDPMNIILDGGGNDRFGSFTENFSTVNPSLSDVYVDSQGVWFLRIRVAVPVLMALQGPQSYFQALLAQYEGDDDAARDAWDLTTKQIGYGTVTVMATDQPTCGESPRFDGGKYWYYDGVRVPQNHARRNCTDSSSPGWNSLPMDVFRNFSEVLVKQFRFGVQTGSEGDYYGGPPPF